MVFKCHQTYQIYHISFKLTLQKAPFDITSYLKMIYCLNSVGTTKLCGSTAPYGIYNTRGRYLTVYFHSDSSIVGSGFDMISTSYHTGKLELDLSYFQDTVGAWCDLVFA